MVGMRPCSRFQRGRPRRTHKTRWCLECDKWVTVNVEKTKCSKCGRKFKPLKEGKYYETY